MIDAERLTFINKMIQLISQVDGSIMHRATEIHMEDFTPGDKAVIHSTSDIRADGQEVTVMGRYGQDMLIIFFDHAPQWNDPSIVISKYCLRKI